LPLVPDAVWTVVVAAGAGTRFGGPKQFAALGGRHVADWAVAAARAASEGVVVVVPPDRAPAEGIAGGATRSESVRRGLAAVPAEAGVICVHDAARPFASPALFAAVVEAVRAGADGAVPGVALADTVKQIDGSGVVRATPERASLVAVQTPQAFRAAALRAAHAIGGEGTDDAALVEAAGGRVVVVPGEADNRKITHPDDLAWARARVEASGASAADAASRPPAGVRVGQGFDVHRFDAAGERRLVLGGCAFPGERGLVGHSDADVVAHAAAEALLGAAGLGDLGTHFPDTDDQWRGADSITLLREVAAMVRAAGWAPGNVDLSVVCERPKLAPRKSEMEARLGAAVGAPVSVKGRRAEGLGAIGRMEGIACLAVAVLVA
jgi:2-C-methyl-D-erythritol 4-phosphate cytidylyltransferase / 2-C-methyl-D-erythritol 2,4-cyclodiphosphate synthase